MSSRSVDAFNWHMKQALYHVNAAAQTAIANHQVGLSRVEQRVLEEIQTRLESLDERE